MVKQSITLGSYFDFVPKDAPSSDWHVQVMAVATNYVNDPNEHTYALLREAWERFTEAQWTELTRSLGSHVLDNIT